MKRKIVFGVVATGILLNLLLLINKSRLIRMTTLKLAGATDVMAATEFLDPDALTIADFSDIPGVTQEYVDAYKLFLKAKAHYEGENTYDGAVAAFEKIAETTKNPELQLRSLFLVTFGNFLQMKIDDAYKSGIKVLTLSKELRKGDERIIFLNKLVSAIKEGEISQVGDIKEIIESAKALETGPEKISDFTEDLSLFQETSKEYQEMKEKARK